MKQKKPEILCCPFKEDIYQLKREVEKLKNEMKLMKKHYLKLGDTK